MEERRRKNSSEDWSKQATWHSDLHAEYCKVAYHTFDLSRPLVTCLSRGSPRGSDCWCRPLARSNGLPYVDTIASTHIDKKSTNRMNSSSRGVSKPSSCVQASKLSEMKIQSAGHPRVWDNADAGLLRLFFHVCLTNADSSAAADLKPHTKICHIVGKVSTGGPCSW